MELDEFLEKVYEEVNDNIKFLEAKNAALITLNSALIALGGNIVFDSGIFFTYRIIIASFVLLLILPLICSIISFRSTTNSEAGIIKKLFSLLESQNKILVTPAKYMYYAYIHKFYSTPEAYLNDLHTTDIDDNEKPFLLQFSQQIIDLAGVAYRKSILFNIAVKIECIIFSLGSILALTILLVKCIMTIAQLW